MKNLKSWDYKICSLLAQMALKNVSKKLQDTYLLVKGKFSLKRSTGVYKNLLYLSKIKEGKIPHKKEALKKKRNLLFLKVASSCDLNS